MANTAVNFRADAIFYQKTKEVLADEKISVSDVLNAALEKLLTGLWIQEILFQVICRTRSIEVAFEDLKKRFLVGHQEIAQGKSLL